MAKKITIIIEDDKNDTKEEEFFHIPSLFFTEEPSYFENSDYCLVKGYFKNNPLEKVAWISCSCPNCSPYC